MADDMTRLRLRIFLLLCLALGLTTAGTVGTMARTAMAVAGPGHVQMVICGPDGARLVTLPGTPAPVDDCDPCPACHMAASGPLPAQHAARCPLHGLRVDPPAFAIAQQVTRPARAHMARAPPRDA